MHYRLYHIKKKWDLLKAELDSLFVGEYSTKKNLNKITI